MLVTIVDNRVFVRLSRRNLRQLDAMLDRRDAGNRWLVRKDTNGVSLVVHVEEDSAHYEGRDPGVANQAVARQLGRAAQP